MRFPGYDIKRTFTSEKIIRILENRDEMYIDTIGAALEKLYQAGYKALLVQPLQYFEWF